MPLFGPPNIAKLKEKRDYQALLAAFHYHESDIVEKPENIKVRREAARALGELGWQPPTTAEQALLASWQERWDLVEAIGSEAFVPLESYLSYVKRDKDKETEREIYELFGKLGHPGALSTLRYQLSTTQPPEIRKTAIRVIHELYKKNPACFDTEKFKREYKLLPAETIEAVRALAEIGGDLSVKMILSLAEVNLFTYAKDEVLPEVRQALINIQTSPGAADALKRHLDDGKYYFLHEVMADALSTFQASRALQRDDGAIQEYIDIIQSSDPGTSRRSREIAAESLIKTHDPRAIDALTALLQNEREGVRDIAAKALSKSGNPRTIGYCLDILLNRRSAGNLKEDASKQLLQLLEKAAAQIGEEDLRRILTLTNPQYIEQKYDDFSEQMRSITVTIDLSKHRSLARNELNRRGCLPNPFRFRNGREAYSPQDLIVLCNQYPDDGSYHLVNGHFEPWLNYLGRPDLVEAWAKQDKSQKRDPEGLLRLFLLTIDH